MRRKDLICMLLLIAFLPLVMIGCGGGGGGGGSTGSGGGGGTTGSGGSTDSTPMGNAYCEGCHSNGQGGGTVDQISANQIDVTTDKLDIDSSSPTILDPDAYGYIGDIYNRSIHNSDASSSGTA